MKLQSFMHLWLKANRFKVIWSCRSFSWAWQHTPQSKGKLFWPARARLDGLKLERRIRAAQSRSGMKSSCLACRGRYVSSESVSVWLPERERHCSRFQLHSVLAWGETESVSSVTPVKCCLSTETTTITLQTDQRKGWKTADSVPPWIKTTEATKKKKKNLHGNPSAPRQGRFSVWTPLLKPGFEMSTPGKERLLPENDQPVSDGKTRIYIWVN